MKRLSLAVASLAVALVLPALAAAQSNVASIQYDQKEEKKIRELYNVFEDAWNAHTIDKMAEQWALDGDHREPDGHLAKGREVLGFKVLGHDRAALVISEIPPDSNAEAAAQSYDEYLAALGPRAQRKVKSAVRYSLSEKGINLVSGKNIAEVS